MTVVEQRKRTEESSDSRIDQRIARDLTESSFELKLNLLFPAAPGVSSPF